MAEKKTISRRTLIDGSVFIVISLVCIGESYRLYTTANPYALAQDLFPGLYIFLLGAVLLVAGGMHIAIHLYAAKEEVTSQADPKGTQIGPLIILGVLVGYAVFIGILGYAAATFGFFVVAFRLFGVRNWFINIPLSLLLATFFYFVFVRYLVIIFPRGMLF